MNKSGTQTIGCEVTSCHYNDHGCECNLSDIHVRPAMNNHSGDQNESLCGSYSHKNEH